MATWHDIEKEAMTGDRGAVLKIVGALRRYRQAADALLSTKWGDGACDGAMVFRFERTLVEIADDIDVEYVTPRSIDEDPDA